MRAKEEAFGDAGLVNAEIAPVPARHRILRARQLVRLWALAGVAPGLYAFTVAEGRLSVREALLAIALGTAGAALVGLGIVRSALRYGVGFLALARAALGVRGGLLLLGTRWLLGVAFMGLWAVEVGSWLRKLLLAAVGDASPAATALRWQPPQLGGLAGASWLLAALLCLSAWPVAVRGMSGLRRWVLVGGVIALASAIALVVQGGMRSLGFGPWIERQDTGDLAALGGAAAAALLTCLPALLACADWMRFRDPAVRERLGRGAAFVLVPAAVALGFVGALLAAASIAVRGAADGAPIPDASGFGGVGAGAVGVLFALGLWLVAAPAVGLYSPALALSGLAPRRVGYRRGVRLTVLAAVLLLPLFAALSAAGVSALELLGLAAAPAALLLVDELLLRRGRLILEDLYLYEGEYGAVGGVSPAALVALIGGWLLHPRLLSLAAPHVAGSLATIVAALAALGVAGTLLAGALFTAALYAALGPLERKVAAWWRRGAGARRDAKQRRGAVHLERARMLDSDDSGVRGETNPFFEYSKVERPPEEPED